MRSVYIRRHLDRNFNLRHLDRSGEVLYTNFIPYLYLDGFAALHEISPCIPSGHLVEMTAYGFYSRVKDFHPYREASSTRPKLSKGRRLGGNHHAGTLTCITSTGSAMSIMLISTSQLTTTIILKT